MHTNWGKDKLKLSTGLGAISLALFVFVLHAGSTFAAPATFTVTNTNNSGAGSLRQAIEDANSNGNPSDMDTIAFAIPGSGVHTINIESDLPAVTEKLTIDGYTQEGAQANTAISPNPINSVIKIEIAGTDGTFTQGALPVLADESVVKGLAIYDSGRPDQSFSKASLGLAGSGTKLQGSYIGVKADGATAGAYDKNCTGIVAFGTNVEIGSDSPEDRNIFFSKCSVVQSAGIAVVNGSTTIFGNYIGMAKDGVTDLTPEAADANGPTAPFSLGLSLLNTSGTSSRLGGPDEGQANLITGNGVGVAISGNQNTIQGNLIGTKYNGEVNKTITNGLGINSTLGTDSLIGGTESGEGNLIAGVKGSGVEFASLRAEQQDSDFVPEKVSVLGNSIYDITPYNLLGVGSANLGIDLSAWTDSNGDYVPDEFANRGPTLNDTSDPDTGPNNYINYPVLKTAQQSGNQLTITYDLDAADSPTDRYRVEFFANNERSIFGYGPGEIYLGAATSVAPGEGKTATLTVNGDFAGKALSATTTAIDATTDSGFGSTSEFAQNISVGSSADFDADGIADAIEAAAPNNGDGNNDGIDDKDQPTVSSFKDYDGTNYLTLITEGCSENGTVSSLNASSLQVKDNGYIYPHGLTNFTLYCSRGDTVNVTLYIHDDTSDPQKYIPRKFNPNTSKFYDVPGSAVATETLGASTAVKLTYSLKDGGDLDDDGEENGVIVDPIGLATEQTGILANTGSLIVLAIPFGIVILVVAVVTYRDYRKHKKPLIDADPVAASSYTYWHHLKVVTVPVAAYRIRFTFEHKQKFDVTPTQPV